MATNVKFFLMVPNYYAHGNTVEECWANLRRISGRTKKEALKNEWFILEFPKGTNVDVNPVHGSWLANHRPIALVEHNLDAERVKSYEAMVRKGVKDNQRRIEAEAEAYRRASRGH